MQFAAAEPVAFPFPGRTFDRRPFSQAKRAASHFIRLSFSNLLPFSLDFWLFFLPALTSSLTLSPCLSLYNHSPPLSLLSLQLFPIFGPSCINYSCLCTDLPTGELSTRAIRVVTLHLSIWMWYTQSHMRMCAQTHTHAYMQLEHRWESVHTLPRRKEKVGRCWCYVFTWLQVEKHMIFQDRCVEPLFFCKVPEKLYCLTCFKSHPKLFCWASTLSFMLYKPGCHLHVIWATKSWDFNQQELKYLREKKNCIEQIKICSFTLQDVLQYTLLQVLNRTLTGIIHK